MNLDRSASSCIDDFSFQSIYLEALRCPWRMRNRGMGLSAYIASNLLNSNPRSLLLMKVINGGLERSLGLLQLLVRGFSRIPFAALCSERRPFGRVGGLLGRGSLLPNFSKSCVHGFPLFARKVNCKTEQDEGGNRYGQPKPVWLYIYPKRKAAIASGGIGAAILGIFWGLLLIQSAGAIEFIAIRDVIKVGCGAILMLLSFALIHVSLNILDGI